MTAPAQVQYVTDESGETVSVIVPIDVWRDIASARETAFLVSASENGMSADEISRTLAAIDAVQPFDLSDDEQAAIEAEGSARKEWEMAHFNERAEQVAKIWK